MLSSIHRRAPRARAEHRFCMDDDVASLSGLAKLRAALIEMEADLGLYELSQNERDVLYAFEAVSTPERDPVSSDLVKRVGLLARMPHATFHRALKQLVTLGFVERAPDSKAKHYRLGRAFG